MPEVSISIGRRNFVIACRDGEEEYLRTAAGILAQEADLLAEQVGQQPEARMLLMAGLMLADKMVNTEKENDTLRTRVAELEASAQDPKMAPAPAAEPERIEVPVEVKVEVPVEVEVEVLVLVLVEIDVDVLVLV